MFSALSVQKSILFALLVSTVSVRSYSPCGSACGSNQKTQRKNCAAVIKDEVHLSDEHKPSELEV